MTALPLAGRVALVAGASRGRGQGIAIELGAAGATVHLLGRTFGADDVAESLSGTRAQIEALGGTAVAHRCDAADSAQVVDVMAKIDEADGRLDIIVNSVFSAPDFAATIGRRAWELTDEDWQRTAETPVRAAFLMAAHGVPRLVRSAAPERPALFVTVSGRGARDYRYNVAYGAGKAAQARMTADLAQELAEMHVAVMDVWPNGYAADPTKPETPRYSGRAVVALATADDLMTRTGSAVWAAQLGAEFGLTDEFGHEHEIGPLIDEMSRPAAALRISNSSPRFGHQTPESFRSLEQ